jgi:F420-dependent oxidoreductase-like protein
MDLRVFVEPQYGATYADQLAMAQAAERLGFDAFFRSDHFMAFGANPLPGPTDSWVTLAAIARETSTIRLGTMVTSATFRPPGLLAVQVAQADEMSGGRVELGLGAGWFQAEHEAYGFLFPPTLSERFERLAEQLEIVTGLWGTPIGETYSFAGRHYSLSGGPALPKPVQSPLPVIVGGLGPRKTVALAARFAQEINVPWVDPATTREQFARVRAACEANGRDPDSIVLGHAISVTCDRDETRALARAEALGLPPLLAANAATGTPEQVVETLQGYAAVGATRSYLQLVDLHDLEHLELIAAEVLPHL